MIYVARDYQVDALRAHAIEGGSGYPILLIHGSGPGASTMGNWRRVLDPLAERFRVHATDLIGFGQSARKSVPPFFDLQLWLRQCEALLAQIDAPRVGILAHSLSAVLALRLAARHKKVAQVLATGAMGTRFLVNEATASVWTFPKDREALRKTAESLVFDRSLIDDAYLDARMAILHGDNSYEPYFSAMFAGDKQAFIDSSLLDADELANVGCPVVLMHGREDVAFPPSVTLELAKQLPQADVALLGRCSHSVAMEYPEKLLSAACQLFR